MITWNVAGLGVADLSQFLLQLEETYPWHVLFLQEAFKKTDNLAVDRGHRLFSATEGPSGFRGPAILIREEFASAFNVKFLGSGVRWVAATVPGVALLLSVHLPHKRQTFLQFLEVLQEVRNFVESQIVDNLKLIVGIDANVQMSACMDHLRVGPAVPYEDEDFNHSSLQRASSLFEWFTDSDLRLVNTTMDEDMGRITTRNDWNTVRFGLPFVSMNKDLHRPLLLRELHVHRWVGRQDPRGTKLLPASIGTGHQIGQTSAPVGVS